MNSSIWFAAILVAAAALSGCEKGAFERSETRSVDLGAANEGDSDSKDGQGPNSDDAVPNDKGKSEEPTDNDKEEKDKEGEKEADLCSKKYADAEFIHVRGNQSVEKVTPSKVLIAKVSGNESELTIDASAYDIDAICLIVTGNQAVVKVTVAKNVGVIEYRGLGNQSHTEVLVNADGTVGAMSVKIAGNESSLQVAGDGKISCDAAPVLNGNDSSYTCPQ